MPLDEAGGKLSGGKLRPGFIQCYHPVARGNMSAERRCFIARAAFFKAHEVSCDEVT